MESGGQIARSSRYLVQASMGRTVLFDLQAEHRDIIIIVEQCFSLVLYVLGLLTSKSKYCRKRENRQVENSLESGFVA